MKCNLCNEKEHDVVVTVANKENFPMCNECRECFEKHLEKLKEEVM